MQHGGLVQIEHHTYVPKNPSPMVIKTMAGEVAMSDDQVSAVTAIMKDSTPIYRLCGGAGVGKSAVIDYLARNLDVTVCATTARAALNVGGCTVDSLFAFRRQTWKVKDRLQQKNMEECGDWIIIDEASMIGTRMATIIHNAICAHGKRLILVGDWAQAPPVKDTWPVHHPLMDMGETIRLTTNHRQGEGLYLNCLKEIRAGMLSPQTRQVFGLRVAQCPQDDLYTYMYGTNRTAEAHNDQRFKILLEQTRCPPVMTKAYYHPVDQEHAPTDGDIIEKILDDCRLAHHQRFCVGARVMTTINNYGRAFVNGDIGVVTGYFSSHDDLVIEDDLFDAWRRRVPAKHVFYQRYDEPIGGHIVGFSVRLQRNEEEVLVPFMDEEMHKPNGELLYRVRGLPLRLAYAMTVHKTQGATLDRAFLAMNTLWWEHGLAYVGLSRTRSIDGLLLEAWRPDFIHCDPRIIPYL